MARRHLTQVYQQVLTAPRMWVGLTLILSLIGVVFVFEASVAEAFATFNDQYHFVKLQVVHLVLGWLAFGVGYFMPSQVWRKISPLLYGLGLILLVLVFIPGFGREINGAYRWLFLGPLRLQPIEFVKLALTFFFATWMSHHQRLGPFLLMTLVPVGLVLLQPDLGSSLLLISIAFGLYFVAGGKVGPLLIAGAVGIILLSLFIVSSEYRRQRVATFINPELDPQGSSFHIRQITLALGRGGVFGQGIGNSKQKFSYIPEASTDSIFAIIAEEIGFAGSALLLSLFALHIWSGYRIIEKSQSDTFTRLVSMGILIWISAQVILNIAAVVALVPLTGVPLPFFSYGGSSLIMVLFASGVLLHASKSS